MHTYSFESSHLKGVPSALYPRLYPLVRTSRVLASGLTTVVTACPASHAGLSGRSGFIGSNREFWGASGVICWPKLARTCAGGASITVMIKVAVVLPSRLDA